MKRERIRENKNKGKKRMIKNNIRIKYFEKRGILSSPSLIATDECALGNNSKVIFSRDGDRKEILLSSFRNYIKGINIPAACEHAFLRGGMSVIHITTDRLNKNRETVSYRIKE
jgi:hypothetical protein